MNSFTVICFDALLHNMLPVHHVYSVCSWIYSLSPMVTAAYLRLMSCDMFHTSCVGGLLANAPDTHHVCLYAMPFLYFSY